MDQPRYILANGTKVITHAMLGTTEGMIAAARCSPRRSSAKGSIAGVVAGCGGDVYWVAHADGDTAAYCFDEFELAEDGNG